MKFLMMIKHAEQTRPFEPPESLNEAMGKFVTEGFTNGWLKDTAGLKPTEGRPSHPLEGRQADHHRRPIHRVQGDRRRLRDRRNEDAGQKPSRSRRRFMELHRIHMPEFECESEVRPAEDM